MRFQKTVTEGLLYGATLVAAAGYADDRVTTEKDKPHVAENFPEFEYEILSPAFLNPQGVPDEFENGTVGPTDQGAMGTFIAAFRCVFYFGDSFMSPLLTLRRRGFPPGYRGQTRLGPLPPVLGPRLGGRSLPALHAPLDWR